MLRLTLRTLLAYIDDTLDPAQDRELGEKIAASDYARELIDKIKKVTRRRGLKTPAPGGKDDTASDPNTVAEYLSDTLDADAIEALEATCLKSDMHLAEVAACHQILTVILAEPVRVPPRANQRMYKLVEPPASVPDRKPGKTVPVGGVAAGAGNLSDTEEHDVSLLLGMPRYAATDSWAGRVGLVGAVAALALMLVVAVLMALPHGQPQAPPREVAAVPPPEPTPEPRKPEPSKAEPERPPATDPRDVAPPPRPAGVAMAAEPPPEEGKVEPKVEPKPDAKMGEPVLAADVPDPLNFRVKAGGMVTPNVIVVTRAADAPAWQRVIPADEVGVMTADTVMALPGYKADVQLDSGVTVHLWGNVPVPVAEPEARLLADARVRFHPAPKDFDADITLLGGRIYVSTRKPGGSRVRVRTATEVWDVTLPDEKADVMVEVVTGFVPGAAGGDGPRTDVRAAVVRGTAGVRAPRRPKDFPRITAPAVVSWDNRSGRLSDPVPVKPEEVGRYSKFTLPEAKEGTARQAALNDLATKLTDKGGLTDLLRERLTEPPIGDAARIAQLQLAIFDLAATLTVDPQPNGVRLLIDRMREQTRVSARLPAITALSYWIAQAPGNAELLIKQLVDEAGFTADDAGLILRLLRGYTPPGRPGSEALDQLVGLLTNNSAALRELALWNLIVFADPDAVRQTGLVTDVGDTEAPGYEAFVRRWKARIEDVKKGPPEKKAPADTIPPPPKK